MNKPMRKLANTVIGVFISIFLILTYIQYIKGPSLQKNHDNSRILYDEYSRRRGQISAGNEVIAYSESIDDYIRQLRRYPKTHALAFAPITGYYSLWYGKTGLEASQNSILSGSDSRLFGSRFLEEIAGRDPRGGSVATTINPAIQIATYDAFTSGCGDRGCKGAAVAIDPNTGKILALVSAPSFNPNDLVNKNRYLSAKFWKEYGESSQNPLIDKALQSTYPPGSTFDILTTAIAFEQGISPHKLLSTASVPMINHSPKTCLRIQNKKITLNQAFQESCSPAFVDLISTKISSPADKIRDMASKFGIDSQAYSLPLPYAISTVGPMIDLAAAYQSSTGGQDIAFTPLTNALIVSSVANNGTVMQPYILNTLERPDLSTLESFSPRKLFTAFSPSTAQKLTQLMQISEKHTIGYEKTDYVIASKTGISQQTSDSSESNTWYIAFANNMNHRIAVAVIVENDGQLHKNTAEENLAASIGRIMIKTALGGA